MVGIEEVVWLGLVNVIFECYDLVELDKVGVYDVIIVFDVIYD